MATEKGHIAVICRFSCAVIALALGSACEASTAFTSHEMSGRVVDSRDGKAVKNAIVAAKWDGSWSGTATSGVRCIRSASVRADEQGRFRLAEWSMNHVDLEDLGVVANAYARGYKTKKVALAGAGAQRVLGLGPAKVDIPSSDLQVLLEPFTGTDRERAAYLSRLLSATECQRGDPAMMPFYRAIREEIREFPPEIRDARETPTRRSLLEVIEKVYMEDRP
jgi:hypothetical protein